MIENKIPKFIDNFEAEVYLNGILPDITFDLRFMDIKIVNAIVAKLPLMINTYKIFGLIYFGINRKDKYPVDFNYPILQSTVAGMTRYNPIKRKQTILLNIKHHDNYDQVLKMNNYYQQIKHISGDNPDVLHTFYHEIGHTIIHTHLLNKNEKILDIFYKEINLSNKQQRVTVSTKGLDNVHEFIAECFADVMISYKPKHRSFEVYKILQKEIGGKDDIPH